MATNKGRVIDFLRDGLREYCDDCLSEVLRIYPRQRINQICGGLAASGLIERRYGRCTQCGKHKTVNKYIIVPSETSISQRVEKEFKRGAENKEDRIREIMSEYLKVHLFKGKVSIFGKEKEFDLVNVENRIVGDIKVYKYHRARPSAEFSTISEYIWLMEKLEKYYGERWKKLIVGSGNKETFEKYSKEYNPWLGDVEIYFVDENGKVQKIRDAAKTYL